MNQQSHASAAPETLSAEDRLSGMLYQFLQLHDRWMEERQDFVAQTAKLDAVIKSLSKEVKTVAGLEPQLSQSIETSIHAAAYRAAQAVKEGAGELADKVVMYHVDQLNQTLGKGQSLLQSYEVQTERASWKHLGTIVLSTVLSGVLVGLLVAKLMMPTVSLPLNSEEAKALQLGQTLVKILPLMSDTEKKRFNQLADKVDKGQK